MTNLTEYKTASDLQRFLCGAGEMQLVVKEAVPGKEYPKGFSSGIGCKVEKPTHEVNSLVSGNTLVLLSISNLGTMNGYITGHQRDHLSTF